MSGKDIGTYHARVEFKDGRGYIQKWSTGAWYVGGGMESWFPLNATRQAPGYENEDAIESNILFMYTEGNYSCDCNRSLFIGYATGEEVPGSGCGDEIELQRITLIRPDGTKKIIYEEAP